MVPTAPLATVLSLLPLALATVRDFSNPTIITSTGGQATCFLQFLDITVQATNTQIKYDNPANQTVLTHTINEFVKPGGTFVQDVQIGPSQIADTHSIFSKLCVPENKDINDPSLDTVQFLTHGGSLTHQYWDIAPDNSYIDAAAKAGYATFSYDRLGAGQSDRPDPIQIVQGSVQVEIMHEFINRLRNGNITGKPFKKVIGISHSLACLLTIGQANRYPHDLDAIVLSGTSITPDYTSATLAAPAYIPANVDSRFKDLPNGYILQAGPQAIQFLFFKWPYYEEKIFDRLNDLKDTATIGEFLTISGLAAPAKDFTGPVYIINGEADYPFCGGNCSYPQDQTALVTPALFPAAAKGSDNYIVPKVGHSVFTHNRDAAGNSFSRILSFLHANQLGVKKDPDGRKQEL